MDAKQLCKRWNVKAKHSLYRKTGDWYHRLKQFPGALFDDKGYILFRTEQEYQQCIYLQIQQDVHVPQGISSIPGYIQIVIGGREYIPLSRDSDTAMFFEGKETRVNLTRYERNHSARKKCIAYYGSTCMVCGINFGRYYGEIAEGIIEVHHLRLVSEEKRVYAVDPIKELRPVCPNCHVLIHRRNPPFTIEEVKQMIKTSNKQ